MEYFKFINNKGIGDFLTNYNLLLLENSKIEGERIYLRPIQLTDADDMFEYTSDEETTKYLYDVHKDVARTKSMIANYFMEEPIGKYAIVLKDSEKMIGAIEFRVHGEEKAGDLGFALNRKYWGNGYVNEAGKLIIDLAFNTLKLERVYAGHDPRNAASGKALKRLGMTYEGTFRKHFFFKGELVDNAQYSILKEEYFANLI